LANADNLIAFLAGWLPREYSVDSILLASGDGALVCDLAEASQLNAPPRLRFLTLSLAGTTSQRLDVRRNRLIEGNMEIGLDCLVPLGVAG
jgi:hypothetical protein